MAQSEGNTNIECSPDSFTLGRNSVELTELSSINKVNLVKVSSKNGWRTQNTVDKSHKTGRAMQYYL
jgi:hypothetical protein